MTYISIEEVAELCHEANRALCVAAGDLSQLPWKDAEIWQREAAISGVCFHLDPVNDDPEKAHLNWCQQKQSDGWCYGAIKDAVLKHHPCLVPYEQLPVIDRAKDLVFVSIVRTLRSKVARHFDAVSLSNDGNGISGSDTMVGKHNA